jgi:hypothetical protein
MVLCGAQGFVKHEALITIVGLRLRMTGMVKPPREN